MNNTYETLLEYIDTLPIIDTHEHLHIREELRETDTDILKEYLLHYFNRDLLSAGLPKHEYRQVIDHTKPLRERWELVKPFWKMCRHTGYGRALDISVEKLYGVEGITDNTIEEVNDRFKQSLVPGTYKKVLKDLCNIEISLVDNYDELDLRLPHLGCTPEVFAPAYRIDRLIFPRVLDDIIHYEEVLDMEITSFTHYLEACEKAVSTAFENGAPVLKCGIAYERSLFFDRYTFSEAEQAFSAILATKHIPETRIRSINAGKALQDYVLHTIMDLVNRKRGRIQFHTGLQEGSGNMLTNSDPTLLSNLFLEYPNVVFDLFHISYPFQQRAGSLAKNFPNVFLDMCWSHIISPAASQQTLYEWLDVVPYSKISAFGGDYRIIDAVYGHAHLAKQDVAKTLATKVDNGIFGIEEAKGIAKSLFYDNPKRILVPNL